MNSNIEGRRYRVGKKSGCYYYNNLKLEDEG